MAINPYKSMLLKVDWFTLVIDPKNDVDLNGERFNLLTYLGYDFEDFEKLSNGRFFLNSGFTLGNYVNVYYDDPSLQISKYSSHLVVYTFTGQGSTSLAKLLMKKYKTDDWEKAWINFFKFLKTKKAHCTRIDLAIDDYFGALDLFRMERKLRAGEYRSSKRRYNIIKQMDTSGSVKGFSIYLGQSRGKVSKVGNYYVRYYDKRAQYLEKNQILPKEVENIETGGGSHHWVRAEIAFQKLKAQECIDKIVEHGSFGYVYRGAMRHIVEFLVKPRIANSNKSRWKVCDWWEAFLDGAKDLKLSNPERDADIGSLLKWLRISVVGTLQLLERIGKKKNFDIYSLIDSLDQYEFSKKQERVYNESLKMSDAEIKDYLEQFVEGDYK